MTYKKDNFYNTFEQRDRLFRRRLNLIKQDDFNQSLSNEIVKRAERERTLKAETMFRLKELQDKIKAEKEAQEKLKKEDKKMAEQLQKEEYQNIKKEEKKEEKKEQPQTQVLLKMPKQSDKKDVILNYIKAKNLMTDEEILNNTMTKAQLIEFIKTGMTLREVSLSQIPTQTIINTIQTQRPTTQPAQMQAGSRRTIKNKRGKNKGRK